MNFLPDDPTVVKRIFDHIDNKTTDLSDGTWREAVASYRSPERFAAELETVFRTHPTAFCPSAALAEAGAYVAREAAGTPILAVRGTDGAARAFRNVCRHRGMQLADGAGCAKSFVCRYHGWTYGIDGRLLGVPHEHGFPGLDKHTRGLVPVATIETGGMVFVAQTTGQQPVDVSLGPVPELFGPDHRLISTTQQEVAANWKIVAEGFLEGYHIRPTHRETFYPIQFDNLNLIELFGRNARVTFPYRRIGKLRAVPPAERSVDGMLTHVYHLFPNVMVATFPTNTSMTVLEPLSRDRTRLVNYILAKPGEQQAGTEAAVKMARDFVNAGAAEDREMAEAIQRGLASDANEFFEFGLFEGAIRHFHRNLHAALDSAIEPVRRAAE